MNIRDQVIAKFGAEDHEQWAVVKYCDAKGYYCWHVPNNTYTTNRFAKIKNMLLGVRPGVSDLFIIAPRGLIVIEMKSLSGSATQEQKDFIDRMRAAGIPAAVCRGAEMAIAFIEDRPYTPPKKPRKVKPFDEPPVTDPGKFVF